jgi:hypothetical protein
VNNKPLRQIIEEVMTVKAQWSIRDLVQAIEILRPDEAPKDPDKPSWVTTTSTTGVAVFFQQTLYQLVSEKKIMRNQTPEGVRFVMTDEHRTNLLTRMEAERHERER